MGFENNSQGETLLQDNISQDHLPTTDQNPKKKRRRVSKACINCRKSHVACDEERPCKRCIKLGIESSCVDVPRRKRSAAGKRKREEAFSSTRYQPPIQPMPWNPPPLFNQTLPQNQQPLSFSALSSAAASLPPAPPANHNGTYTSQLMINGEQNMNNMNNLNHHQHNHNLVNNNVNISDPDNNNNNNYIHNNNNITQDHSFHSCQDTKDCTCGNNCQSIKNPSNNNIKNDPVQVNSNTTNTNGFTNIDYGFPSPGVTKPNTNSTTTNSATSNIQQLPEKYEQQTYPMDQFGPSNNPQNYSIPQNEMDDLGQISLSPLFDNIDSAQFFDSLINDPSGNSRMVNNPSVDHDRPYSRESDNLQQTKSDSSSAESLVLSSPEDDQEIQGQYDIKNFHNININNNNNNNNNYLNNNNNNIDYHIDYNKTEGVKDEDTDDDVEKITRDIQSLRFLGHQVETMIGQENNGQAWQSVQELLQKVDHLSSSLSKVVPSDTTAVVPSVNRFRTPTIRPLVTWQACKRMLSCNKEFIRLLGYEGDPSFGPGKTTVGDVLHPLNYYHVFHAKKKQFPSGASCQMERDAVFVTKNRTYIGVRFIFELTYGQGESPVFLQRILKVYSTEETAEIINRYARQISERAQVELLGPSASNTCEDSGACAFIPPLESNQTQ